jgi:hypothetical protein
VGHLLTPECSFREIRDTWVARESLLFGVRPAPVCRGTRLTPGPLAEPEEASGQPLAESQIEPWFAPVRPETLAPCPTEPELEPEVSNAEED